MVNTFCIAQGARGWVGRSDSSLLLSLATDPLLSLNTAKVSSMGRSPSKRRAPVLPHFLTLALTEG